MAGTSEGSDLGKCFPWRVAARKIVYKWSLRGKLIEVFQVDFPAIPGGALGFMSHHRGSRMGNSYEIMRILLISGDGQTC